MANMSRPTKTDEEVLRDIESGKYRDFYLIYVRKSTDDVVNQKNSLAYQKVENARYAKTQGLRVAPITLAGFSTGGIVSERFSAFKESAELVFGDNGAVQYQVQRPKFYQLAQWLSKGHFKGVIIMSWDRASRNKGDDNIIRKLMKGGVDFRFALTQYEKTSSGELHLDIDGMFAMHHSRTTREKVTLTIRNARSRGLCTNRAPVGYINKGNMLHKPFDPARAPIIKCLFEMAATGDWSLADLARWAIEQGLTMPPQRRRRTREEILAEEEDDVRVEIEPICRPPTANSIHKILTNPFYAGMVPYGDGKWGPSTSHESIVDEWQFKEVQEQLRKKNKGVHYKKVLEHPLRGVARCGDCGRVYTPYAHKGILYYGSRCKKGCANELKNVNFDYIAEKAGGLIGNLAFTDEELAEIDARASTDIATLDAKRINKIEAGERRKKKVREDLAYLNANRLTLLQTGVYTPESLMAEVTKLDSELAMLNSAEAVSDSSMAETIKDAIKLSELLKNIAVIYDLANPSEKDRIIRTIFSELTLTQNTLGYKCKKGFEALAGRFTAICDPTGIRTPI